MRPGGRMVGGQQIPGEKLKYANFMILKILKWTEAGPGQGGKVERTGMVVTPSVAVEVAATARHFRDLIISD